MQFQHISKPARAAAIGHWLAETEPNKVLVEAMIGSGHFSESRAQYLCRQMRDAGLDDIADMPNYTTDIWAVWFDKLLGCYVPFNEAVKLQRVVQQLVQSSLPSGAKSVQQNPAASAVHSDGKLDQPANSEHGGSTVSATDPVRQSCFALS